MVINNKSIALTENFVIITCCNETSLAGLRVSKQLFLLLILSNTNTPNTVFYYLLFQIVSQKLSVFPNSPLVAKKHYLYLNSQIVKYQIAALTYSSHKRRETLFHALQPASSYPAPHRKQNVLTFPPPQAPLPLPKPLLLSAATRTARRRHKREDEGRGGRSIPRG
jgi:hypothetical protein